VASIAVDGTSVYWATSAAVMKVPLGGGPITTLASGAVGVSRMAVDAVSAYWTYDSGDIMKVPIGGGAVTTLASTQCNLGYIAVDSTSVYYTEPGSVLKLTPK
jgi:hypothetical protein